MSELAVDIAQILLLALHAGWLGLGALDNLRHPDINRADVAKVLALEALADEPEIRARVAHRAITDQRTVHRLFAVIVAVELLVALALVVSALALLAALFGIVASGPAHAVAILAVTGFIVIWGAFMVGGQWFYYWYGAFGQTTHLLATIWGTGTLIVLVL